MMPPSARILFPEDEKSNLVAASLHVLVRLLAQLGDRLADETRDVHLRDADAGADLRLRQVLGEAQPEHLALALGEDAHEPLDGGRVLGDAEARILPAHRRTDGPLPLLLVVARAVERDRAVGA